MALNLAISIILCVFQLRLELVLCNYFPFISHIYLSFTPAPEVECSIRPLKAVDVMEMPFVSNWLTQLIETGVGYMVWPSKVDIPLSQWYSEPEYAHTDSEMTDSEEETTLSDSEVVMSTHMENLCDDLEEDLTDVVDFDDLVAPSVPILSSDEFFTEARILPKVCSNAQLSTPISTSSCYYGSTLSSTPRDPMQGSIWSTDQSMEAPMPWNIK